MFRCSRKVPGVFAEENNDCCEAAVRFLAEDGVRTPCCREKRRRKLAFVGDLPPYYRQCFAEIVRQCRGCSPPHYGSTAVMHQSIESLGGGGGGLGRETRCMIGGDLNSDVILCCHDSSRPISRAHPASARSTVLTNYGLWCAVYPRGGGTLVFRGAHTFVIKI